MELNKNCHITYEKVVDSNTLLVEKNTKLSNIGAFVDVFPIDWLGNNLSKAKKSYYLVKKYNIKLD